MKLSPTIILLLAYLPAISNTATAQQTYMSERETVEVSNPSTYINATVSAESSSDSLFPRTHATLFGIGRVNELDTYLSPQEYVGTQMSLLREHNRPISMFGFPIQVENLLHGTVSYTKSPTEDGKNLSGMIHWGFSWHYHWQPVDRLTLSLGPGTAFHGGFCYNTRNGNNPAQAYINADINAVGTATWQFYLGKKNIKLCYRAELPLFGLTFSPNYGQSYYEIFSLGHYDHNVCITHPFQAFSIDQMLTADLPLGCHLLRIGYLFSMRQHQVNNIKQHSWSHTLLIGYVKHFYLVRPSRNVKSRQHVHL